MKKAIWTIPVLLVGAAVMHADNLVTTRPNNGTDSVNWSQLGSSLTAISNPFSFTTANSVSGTGSYASGNGEVMQEESSWAGNFSNGDILNWTTGSGTLTLNFSAGYTQIGAQIQRDIYGAFTAQICDINACFTEGGNSNGNNDGSAIYIGIESATPITSVTFDESSGDFAINQLTLGGSGASPVPEPSSLLLLGSGLAGMVGMVRRKLARG
jgi:hypothetical protein